MKLRLLKQNFGKMTFNGNLAATVHQYANGKFSAKHQSIVCQCYSVSILCDGVRSQF